MSRARSIVALLAVLTLPVAAALASHTLAPRSQPPRAPAVVRIGESPPPPLPGTSPTTSPAQGTQQTEPAPGGLGEIPLPPPPPLDDDDDDDGDDG